MSFFVYIHTCPNGKKYVGGTVRSPKRRWNNGNGYTGNLSFYNDIQKYGWNNIKHEIFETKSKCLMAYWERLLIYHYNTIDNEFGYNQTSGGEQFSGWQCNEDLKNKMSKIVKGRKLKPLSEDTKKKISETLKGRKLSAEHKKNIGKGGRGRKHSEETRKKMSESTKGRIFSEESKKKMSEARKLYWENKRKNNT